MNIITKRKPKNLISQSDINIISPLGHLESHKILYFQKIDSVSRINTFGSQPIIVYKKSMKNLNQNQKNLNKTSKKSSRYEKINKSESESKVFNDINLEKKIQKIKSFSGAQKNFNNNKKIIKTKSFQKNIILIKKDKKLKEENEKKKNINEQKLFSKTVRDSNMRPVFPKNKNKQMNMTKNAFYDKNKSEKKISEENEEFIAKKNLMMEQLVQNAVVVEMKKIQNDLINNNKKNIKEIKNIKKREYLEENGITTSTEELTINDDNNDKIDINDKSNKKSSYPTKINNYLFQEDMIKNNIPPISPKMKNKPEIEQFEFINKINEEKKKLLSEMKKIYHKSSQNKNDNNIILKNNFIPSKIYPSFRSKNKPLYEEENKTLDDSLEQSYSLKDRKNHRTQEEINQYLKEKKIKYKQMEETKQLEKNKKLFVRFKNLYNLNMTNNNTNNQISPANLNNNFRKNKKLKIEERKDSYIELNEENDANEFSIKNNIILSNNENYNNIRKKKELNDYYLGSNTSLRNNNNSTLVDVNEYYLNILESQQLLVNSKLKKIEDETDNTQLVNNEETTNNINNINENVEKNNENSKQRNNLKLNENDLNSMNLSDEQLKKITEKEITKTSNSKKITDEILNTSSIEELKLKINTTLKRANIFLSKQNAPNSNITEITTSNIQNNLNSDTNTNNNNINIKEEKEKETEAIKEEETINKIMENNDNKENTESDNIEEEEKNDIIKDEIISNTETKQENKKPLDSRLVLNLIEVIKFIIQRRTFVVLYESFINHAIYQQYKVGFSYLAGICKQYAFKKLEEYYNYKTYNYAFRQMLRPFIKYNFKYFLSRFQMKEKTEYMNTLLTKMIKFKTFERIFLYSQYILEEEKEEEFKVFLIKVIHILIRPYLYEAFYVLKDLGKKEENYDEDDFNSNLSDDKMPEDKDEKYENEVNFNISDDEDIMSEKSFNNNKNKLNAILNKSEEKNNDIKINHLNNILNSNSSEEKDENNSSLEIPKDDKLHKLKLLLLEKNKNFETGLNDNYNIDEIYNSSKKSDKSLQELIKIGKNGNKTLSDMMDENSYQKSPEEKNENDFNNLKKTLRSQISEGKNEKTKDEGNKVINDTKDTTKEIIDDSNTFNLNTNNKSDLDKNKIGTDTNSNSEIKKNNKQNIKINNIQKKIDYEEEEKNEILLQLEDNNKEIKDKESEQTKKTTKILKNYKIIEKPEKLENLITDEEKPKSEDETPKIQEKKKIKIPLIKIINDSNDSSSENKNSKEEISPKNKFSSLFENPSQLTDDLVNQIVNEIIFSEIKSPKIKLLPNKKYKFEKFIKKSTSLHEDLFSLNDSLNSNYSVYSVFNKTIKDKKKEHSLHLYFDKICPKLISYLHSEIIKKYPKIYDNISLERKNNSEKLMISLVLQDAQMLRNNYRKTTYKESLEKILDKKEILKNFAKFNKQIRQEDNITTDNYYDNMLNECVLETALELIEKERYYGETGNPLKWSNRTRDIMFKYEKNDAKKFADFICKNILSIVHNRIGLINDNYSFLNQDEINYEREKRLMDIIKSDLKKNEYQWKNLEMEETQLKVESTEIILDQLYNEVIEILEHIQYNRISPELYQNKSIYACEEIPKLSFQQTTTEDVGAPEGEESDMLNI